MASPLPLSAVDALLVRARLSRELHSMHRPEYSDLLGSAEFALAGRTLLVHLCRWSDQSLEEAFTMAALRAGLPVDAASLC
ncbi:MAG TPA: hypothetical protein VLJ11_10400 [Bryobacteraceae bacterium]|nr:hypothetical protein [Bryobacteraceae bacterium]